MFKYKFHFMIVCLDIHSMEKGTQSKAHRQAWEEIVKKFPRRLLKKEFIAQLLVSHAYCKACKFITVQLYGIKGGRGESSVSCNNHRKDPILTRDISHFPSDILPMP